ncbi:MFS transporter [Nonomuraea sp. NPDC052116]|uniref:MFS transporter n=1 Tax=Nonomuraea sp. NPDC052116 TaxID=3155665 RepID=UPI00342A21A9
MTRDFRLFQGGQVASAFGSVFTVIAVPLVAVQYLGASPAETGFLVAAGSLPLPLLGLFISSLVDRLRSRRRVLIACDLTVAAALGLTIVSMLTGRLSIWALGALVFVIGTVGVMVETLYLVYLKTIVGTGDIVKARARLNRGEYVGGTLGRALAGPAAALGPVVPFVVDTVSRLISAGTTALIRTPERPAQQARQERSFAHELGAGFRSLWGQPFLRALVPFLVGQQLVMGMTLALVAPYVLKVLHVPAQWYGLLFVLLGVAGVTGTFLSELLSRRLNTERLTMVGLIGGAIGTVALPLAGGPVLVAAITAGLGIGLPYLFGAIANVGLLGFVTIRIPEEVLGRLSVSVQLLTAAGAFAGALVGGALGQQAGIVPTLWVACGVSAVSMLLLLPVLRVMRAGDERTPDHAPAAAPAAVPVAEGGDAERPA